MVRSLPDPGFAGDDGAADPVLAEALASYDRSTSSSGAAQAHHGVLALLQDARVLVPVVATGDDHSADRGADQGADRGADQGVDQGAEQGGEKTSDMAAVLMTGRDGRTALLGFTGTAALATWDAAARPVPVSARQAAQAAIQDEASALLLDVAGPVLFVVERDDLESLAEGHRLVRLDERWAWVRAG